MRPYIFIAVLVVIIGYTIAIDVDLNDALNKANEEIKSNLMNQMMAGAKSRRMHKRKFTKV